jgi:hypothetical protein
MVAVFAVVTLEACVPAASVRIGSRVVSFNEAVERAVANEQRLRTLNAEANLTIETPSFNQSATVFVRLHRPDSLLLSVRGPFGINVGSALMTPTSFQFYNSLQNTLYIGEPTRENLLKFLQVDVAFADIVSWFTGGTFLTDDRRTPDDIRTDGEHALFRFESGPYSREYRLDAASLTVRQILVLDQTGAPIVEQSYDRYESFGDVELPRSIKMTMHKSRRRISLYYETVSTNTPLPTFRLDIPTSAERVMIE